ncbi:unnamed protein product [Meganyctiphanes norvegica]|uniref:Uncharacterized protein n=1 Tax=Meganyctiphanes norvegica TaxID=48144 RepID=A0AAV2R7A9_MEGNR
MSIYNSALKTAAEDLLQALDDEDLVSLAKTATNNRITPETKKESIDAILLHTPNVKRLLSYRRITTQKLFQYLHKNKVSINGYASRSQLANTVEVLWGESDNHENGTQKKHKNESNVTEKVKVIVKSKSLGDEYETKTKLCKRSSLNPEESKSIRNLEETHSIENLQVQRSDDFSQEFCRWFYTMINRLQPECSNQLGDNFREQVFSGNSSVGLYFLCEPYKEMHGKGRIETFTLFKNVVCEYRFIFSPNLENGIGAEKSPHGMVKIFCCGTLHQGSAFIGIFEQEFGLVFSPADQAWLIMNTKVNFKHTLIQEIPTLPPYEIFAITAS